MSRGIVLWPDRASGGVVQEIWDEMTARGIPSMATHTHELHQPHVSLTVAGHLPPEDALAAVGNLPLEPISLLVEAAGVYPGGGLVLACVTNEALMDQQRRVHHAIRSMASDLWPHFEPGTWSPHITLGRALSTDQLTRALQLVLDRLPIEGWLDHGGVEDGTTGENWPARVARDSTPH